MKNDYIHVRTNGDSGGFESKGKKKGVVCSLDWSGWESQHRGSAVQQLEEHHEIFGETQFLSSWLWPSL